MVHDILVESFGDAWIGSPDKTDGCDAMIGEIAVGLVGFATVAPAGEEATPRQNVGVPTHTLTMMLVVSDPLVAVTVTL